MRETAPLKMNRKKPGTDHFRARLCGSACRTTKRITVMYEFQHVYISKALNTNVS